MRLTALGILLLLVFGCIALALAQQSTGPTFDPVAGSRLVVVKGCVACHAVSGTGGVDGPDLAKIERPQTLYDLSARMWNHLPKMAQRISALRIDRPYLTAVDLGDLMAFLGTLGTASGHGSVGEAAPLAGDPDSRRRGEAVVAAKGCLECHALPGADVRGKAGGSFDRWIGFDSPWMVVATMWNHAFLMEIDARRQGRAWPTLSAVEMADLTAFLTRK